MRKVRFIKGLLLSLVLTLAQGQALARYVQADPIGLDGGFNRFEYVRGNPLREYDAYGLAPGDLFDTSDAAAQDAFAWFRGLHNVDEWEYGAAVYYLPNICKYSYNAPQTDRSDSYVNIPGDIPENSRWIGDIHNHPRNVLLWEAMSGNYTNFSFSPRDIIGNKRAGTIGYLFTPRNIVKYIPSTWVPISGK